MPPHRLVLSLAVVVVVIAGVAGVVGAHETTTVEGYELTFGGSDEPVITGERMWLQLEILEADTGEPVEGLEGAIELSVQRPFGDDTFDLEVGAVHGQPGLYQGAVVFTEPGTYTVYVEADVDGTAVETSFQTQVHNASTLRYPPPAQDEPPATGMDAAMGFGAGVVVAAVGMAVAYGVGRRRGGA